MKLLIRIILAIFGKRTERRINWDTEPTLVVTRRLGEHESVTTTDYYGQTTEVR